MVAMTVARRTSANSVLNDTVRDPDPVLQANLEAGGIYRVLLVVSCWAGATADFSWGTHYSGTLLHAAGGRLHKNVGTISALGAIIDELSGSHTTSYNNTGFTLAGNNTTTLRGFVICEAFLWTDTAGVFSIRHAQNTASNTAGQESQISAGSWLMVERIDAAEPEACLFVQKANNEARSNTTTLAADSDLNLALAANTTYFFEACLQWTSAATPDIKLMLKSDQDFDASFNTFQESNVFLHTASQGIDWTAGGGDLVSSFVCGIGIDQPGAGGSTVAPTVGGTNLENVVRILAIITTGANAPTINPWWAQNTLDAVNNTTMLAGSWMVARRVP